MSTYTQLLSDVAAWTARSDLTSVIPSFIQLAEDKIDRQVRVAEMRDTVRKAFTAATPSIPLSLRTKGRFLEPHVVRTLDANGGTACVYDMAPEGVFREIARQKSGETVFAVDAVPNEINATVFDGANSLLNQGGAGLTDDDVYTLIISFETTASLATQRLIGGNLRLTVTSSGDLEIDASTSGGTKFLTVGLASGILPNTRYNVVTHFDATDHDVTINGVTTTGLTSTTIPGDIDFSGDFEIGGQSLSNYFTGTIHSIGLLLGTAVDTATAYSKLFDIDGVPIYAGESAELALGVDANFWYPDGGGSVLPSDGGNALEVRAIDSFINMVTLLINPAVGENTTVEMSYYQGFSGITDDAENNWLINQHYDIYLYGTLAEAYDYLQDAEQELRYREKFAGAVKSLNDANLRKLIGTGPFKRRHTGRRTP